MNPQPFPGVRMRFHRGALYFLLTDLEDEDTLLRQRRWRIAKSGHVRDARGVPIHRTLMGLETGDGYVVHHRNKIKLDNRRSNLVVCENQQEHIQYHSDHTGPSSGDINDYFLALAERMVPPIVRYIQKEIEAAAA